MLTHPHRFISNSADDLHCFQATFRMAWEGLEGVALSESESERLTRFRPGLQTWPFSGMLAAAEAGMTVTSIEDFDAVAFVADPEGEIRRQSEGDEDLIAHVLKVAPIQPEQEAVARCLAHPLITFEKRRPEFVDLQTYVSQPNTAVICNVNYYGLVDREGYTGHFVLVTAITEVDIVVLDDPGLPPLRDKSVSRDQFVAAWCSPSPANILAFER